MVLNFKTLIELTIPHFLSIVFLAPVSTFLIIYKTPPGFEIIPIILSLSFAVLAFNSMNMIYDFELDKIEKPLRPLPRGDVTKNEAWSAVFLFYACSILISIFVNKTFFVLILAFILTAYLYSHPKINLKKYFWTSSIVGTVLYGIIPFLSAWSLKKGDIPIYFLFLFASFFFIISNTKDFEDLEGEKKVGINSMPLKFGWKTTKNFIITGVGILIVITALLSSINYLPYKYLYASAVSFVLFLVMIHLFATSLRKLQCKQIIFRELKNSKMKDIISQSDAVSINVSMILVIELIYGFFSII